MNLKDNQMAVIVHKLFIHMWYSMMYQVLELPVVKSEGGEVWRDVKIAFVTSKKMNALYASLSCRVFSAWRHRVSRSVNEIEESKKLISWMCSVIDLAVFTHRLPWLMVILKYENFHWMFILVFKLTQVLARVLGPEY